MNIWELNKLISKHVLHIAIQFHACKPANQQAKVKLNDNFIILGRVCVDLITKGLLITDNERKSRVVLQGQLDDCPEIDTTTFILWHPPPRIQKKAGDLFSLFNFRFHAFTGLQLGHKF